MRTFYITILQEEPFLGGTVRIALDAVEDPGVIDWAGREIARVLLETIETSKPVEVAPDPVLAVLRDLFDRWASDAEEEAIDRLARKHGGDAPDLLADRLRAIVGGGR